MRKYILALAALVALTFSHGVALAQSRMLESVNFPGMFIRHSNFKAVLTAVQNNQDKKDAVFWGRTGLTGFNISFESYNFPGYFLRHKNFKLVLEKNDGSKLFKKDATFKGQSQGNLGYMFEAVNFPGFFLRHKKFKLVLEKNDGSVQFLADATFKMEASGSIEEAAAPPPPPHPTARIDTTIFDAPQGNDVAYLEANDPVTIISCTNEPDNNWCEISEPRHGFVFGSDLNL